MAQEMSVLLEAREIVKNQTMSIRVGHLRKCADALHEAYDVLCVSCSRSASNNFVAAFTRVLLAIEQVHAATPPSPHGGSLPKPVDKKPTSAHSAI